MKDNLLQELSKDVLVIPLSDDAVKALEQFCVEEKAKVTSEKVSQLILCSILKTQDEELHQRLAEYAKDKNVLSGLPIQVMEPFIAEYLVLQAIDNEDDPLNAAVYSLMLKNAMILVVKGTGMIANPQAVAACYQQYKELLDDEYTYATDNSCDLINDYFSNHVGKESYNTTAKDKVKELRCVFYDASLYRYEQLKKAIEVEMKDKASYVKAYLAAHGLINGTPWLFIEKDAGHTLWALMGGTKAEIERKTLAEIRADIQATEEYDGDMNYEPTSVLLNFLSGKEDAYQGQRLADIRLTPMEFAIYTYYELLAEEILTRYIRKEDNDE